jgi:hypothetical protein
MLRKILTSSLLFLVVVGGFFVNIKPSSPQMISFVSETHAAPQCGGPNQAKCTADEEMLIMYNKLVAAINIFLDILTFVVSPAIMLAGWLMSPDWTSGDLFNLRPILHDLWVLVSNITYFIYALLLIFIALATIFNSQNYGYKKLLPRLALGIILVPLTWWFVQFIISLSTIVTASVMNLPTEVMDKFIAKNNAPDAWWNVQSIPQTFELFTDPAVIQAWAQKQYTQWPFLSPKEILTKSSWIYGSLLIYGNGIFKLNESKRLSTGTDMLESIAWLVNKWILSIVMFIVFGFLVIALVFMLMMRAIKLWFYAIFSPLMTLRYVVGPELFGGKENSDGFELKEFIGLAFVPALVGLALSFGIVVVSVLQSPTAWNKTITCTNAAMLADQQWCKIMNIMGSNDNYILRRVIKMENGNEVSTTEVVMWWITFRFYGSAIKDAISWSSVAQFQSALSNAWNVFWTLIVNMISLIFIWAAFMAAKNVSKVAKAAFAPFEAIGTKVGKMAMDIPKYTPIPGTDGLSVYGATKLAGNAERALSTAHDKEFENTKWWKMFGGDKYMSDEQSKKLSSAIKNGDKDYAAVHDLIKANANKWEWHKWTHVEALGEQLRGKTHAEQEKILKDLRFDDAASAKIIDFMKSDVRSKLKNEVDQKDLWDLMKSAVGASSSKAGTNGATGYTWSWIWTNTVSLNFNGTNIVSERWANVEETQKKIIEWMTSKLDEMKKKGVKVDESTLTIMLEWAGIPSAQAWKMSKSILEKDEFKAIVKTNTPPPAAAPWTPPPTAKNWTAWWTNSGDDLRPDV